MSFLLSGCAGQYSMVEFEVLEPATIEFPDYVTQLVFLNRAPISLDIWAEQNQEGMDARQLVLLDTLIINNLFRGVLEVLQNTPAERFHTPIWLSDRRSDTAFLEDRVLTKREVAEICDTIGGDAIVSLELYTVGIDQHFDYYEDAPNTILNHYFIVSDSMIWKIYLPQSPKPFDSYTMVDTLYFPSVILGEFLPFSASVDMLRELFHSSGFKYGSYLVPVWNQTSRVLYRGRNDYLKMAVDHTDEGDWESAFTLWDELTASDDSSLVAKAFHNMAVYYELEDKLDTARMMLDLSLEHDSLEAGKDYSEELEVRILNRKDIIKQVF